MREPSPIHRTLAELVILGLIEIVPGSNPRRYRAVDPQKELVEEDEWEFLHPPNDGGSEERVVDHA